MKKTLLTVAATAAAVAITPAAAFAQETPQQFIKVKLTSTKAGTTKKPTAVGVTFTTGTSNRPSDPTKRFTITTAKISLPKGIKINYKAFPECDLPAEAEKTGSWCEENAPKSKVGSGTAKASVVDIPYEPEGTLTPYIGSNGRLLIRTQFDQPAVIDQPLIGNVSTSGGAYSFGFKVPESLQTPIDNADQQILDFALKFDKKTVKKGKKKIGLVELTSCPKGGYVFKGDFTFKDGSTASTSATVPCKK